VTDDGVRELIPMKSLKQLNINSTRVGHDIVHKLKTETNIVELNSDYTD
jgi:hypothetical protein